MIETINPTTGEVISEWRELEPTEVGQLISVANLAQQEWSRRTLDSRLDVLSSVAAALENEKRRLAELMTIEMGKPISASISEVEKCAWLCRHYVEAAPTLLADVEIPTDAAKSYVRYDPLGLIFAVMPWNFPMWQVFRFAVPNLALGNGGLLKHAQNVTGTAIEIEALLIGAGLPEGVFSTLVIDHDTAAQVIADPRVRGVTLTGSEAAGRSVAAAAGKHLKKTVLELGGSDPLIVLNDADINKAAGLACDSRFLNNGQSCINAKRFIVVRERYREFVSAVTERVAALKLGDPMDPSVDVGPMARADLRDEVADQVRRSVEQGARLLVGGTIPEGPGSFYAPTVLADVPPDAASAAEEVFGPVASVLQAEDAEDAIRLANASPYGLGASIHTADEAAAEAMAARLDAGMVFINSMVASDPRLPFGGVKNSGYGRELGPHGTLEFANVKTVSIAR